MDKIYAIRCAAVLLVLFPLAGTALAQEQPGEFEGWQELASDPPQWYEDAKFGIYFHWGVYSVPAHHSEWYSRNMYNPDTTVYEHHVETYSPVHEFGYKDFVPMFRAESFDADAWVDLFVRAGARFTGPVAEHADGFSMWDSEVNSWNSSDRGARHRCRRGNGTGGTGTGPQIPGHFPSSMALGLVCHLQRSVGSRCR